MVTAYNADWPPRPGLHWRVLHDEARAIVDGAKELNCNVIILQVRAFADRLHRGSRLRPPEPWSAAINLGNDRDPDKSNRVAGYDPLADWITMCHDAGMELHAWVNPFRVDRVVRDHRGQPYPVIASPDFQTAYLDYTQTSVQNYVLEVIEDLLKYRPPASSNSSIRAGHSIIANPGGIDGLIFDHNMLPTPPPGSASTRPALLLVSSTLTPHQERIRWLASEFGKPPGQETIDGFISKVFHLVYEVNNRKFGISPSQNDGKARDWLKNGRVNYVIPELYTKGAPGFVKRDLKGWLDAVQPQATFTPIVVAGLHTTRVQSPDGPDVPWRGKDIIDQINDARDAVGSNGVRASGQAHYSWSAMRSPAHGGPPARPESDGTLGEQLKKRVYVAPVAVPNCTAAVVR